MWRGVEFCTFPLTCVIAITTLLDYHMRVWCSEKKNCNKTVIAIITHQANYEQIRRRTHKSFSGVPHSVRSVYWQSFSLSTALAIRQKTAAKTPQNLMCIFGATTQPPYFVPVYNANHTRTSMQKKIIKIGSKTASNKSQFRYASYQQTETLVIKH